MREKILERLKKMLAHAHRADENPAEAAAFAEKIQEYLDKYNLSLSDVERFEAGNERIDVDPVWNVLSKIEKWKIHLLQVIAKTNGCQGIYSDGTYGMFFVAGRATDRRVVIEFYRHFALLAEELVAPVVSDFRKTLEFMMTEPSRRFEEVEAFRDGWLVGFAEQVGNRLIERHNQSMTAEGSSAALAVINDRHSETLEWLKNKTDVEFDRENEPDDVRPDAYIAGAETGEKIALTNKIVE